MIDIIHEYLVEIGFQVDKSSYTQAEQSIKKMESTLEKFFKSLGQLIKRFVDGISENKIVRGFLNKATNFFNKIGPKIETFLMTTKGLVVTTVGAIVAAIVAGFVVMTHQLHKFMSGVAQADIEVQKFARRMLTTVANARSLKAVIDAMGVESLDDLNDVAFNPELRAQFLALRGVASGLNLGEDAQQGLKNIRAFNFEFRKMSLIMNYFFQQLAGYLGKFLSGPMQELQQFMAETTDFIQTHAVRFAKDIAQFIGLFYKLVQIVAKFNHIIFGVKTNIEGFDGALSGVEALLNFFDAILDKITEVLTAIEKFKIPFNSFTAGQALGRSITSGDPIKRLLYYVQRIYEVLSQFWVMLSRFFRDPLGLLAEKGSEAFSGIGNALNQATERTAKKHKGTLDYLLHAANLQNLQVTSTNGGDHNEGSKHYTNEAIDVSHKGVTPQKLSQLRAAGITVIPELTHPKGQKKWSGPHYHLQMTTAQYASRMASQTQAAQKPSNQMMENNGTPSNPGVQQQVSIFINGGGFNEDTLAAKIQQVLQTQAMVTSRVQSSQFA